MHPADHTQLRDRLEELEFENRELRARLGFSACFPAEWKLTRLEARMLGCLAGSAYGFRGLTTLQLLSPQELSIQCVRLHMHKLRRKLAPYGIEINTRWAEGYELPPRSLKIVRAARLMEATVDGSSS